jgi:hypothetical protein
MQYPPRPPEQPVVYDRNGHCVVCKLDDFGIRYGNRKASEFGEDAVMRSACGHVHAYRSAGIGPPRNSFLEDQERTKR